MKSRFYLTVAGALTASITFGAPVIESQRLHVRVGSEVGKAMEDCTARFRSAPFDSLPWLRADLTGETVSPYDSVFGHVMRRPYKEYSGDISGRFIEIMALSSPGDAGIHPALAGLLATVPRQQRPGGYFCASGTIDWQKPFDFAEDGSPVGKRMLPALWGNSRMLCGLVEAVRTFPADKAIAKSARALGEFYLSVMPRFNDPSRIEEYKRTGTYASGYVTCWFPAMEGLVRLGNLTGEKEYVNAAGKIADFYQQFDRIPVDHAHGMLCCQVALLDLYEATKDASYLKRVEQRWDELVQGGYINPAGGILEKCQVSLPRCVDEGCAIADWLRLNLALGRVTKKDRYWAMAERTLHNHLLRNQTPKGGFGHRRVFCDEDGAWGFSKETRESIWCCTYHGELGFIILRDHLLSRTEGSLSFAFALDFTATAAVGTTVSRLRDGLRAGEVLRQRVSLTGQPATVVRVRQPHWANGVTAVDPAGKVLETDTRDGWCVTKQPVTEVEFVYTGGVYVEDRRCTRLRDGPEKGKPYVIGYGPKIMAAEGDTGPAPGWPTTIEALKAIGFEPFATTLRGKDCRFVVIPDGSLKGGDRKATRGKATGKTQVLSECS